MTAQQSARPAPAPFSGDAHGEALAHFDRLATHHKERLPDELASAGLPQTILPSIRAQMDTVFAGVRLALERWTTRPPISNAKELQSLLAEVSDITQRQVNARLDEYVKLFMGAAGSTQKQLREWGQTRPSVVQPTHLSPEQRAYLRDRRAGDHDHIQIERIDDKQIRVRHGASDERDGRDEWERVSADYET